MNSTWHMPVLALLVAACAKPPEAEPEAPYTNPYVGNGPELRCPLDFGDDEEQLGVPLLPIDGEEARRLAEGALPPSSVEWRLYPPSADAVNDAVWTFEFPDEPVQVAALRPSSGELSPPASSSICPAGPAWFVPVVFRVEFDNGLLLEAPTGIQVFNEGQRPEEVRLAAVVTAPLEFTGELAEQVQEERAVWSDSIFEADVSDAVAAPEIGVRAYSERAAGTVWLSDTEGTVPCNTAYERPCDE